MAAFVNTGDRAAWNTGILGSTGYVQSDGCYRHTRFPAWAGKVHHDRK